MNSPPLPNVRVNVPRATRKVSQLPASNVVGVNVVVLEPKLVTVPEWAQNAAYDCDAESG
jgi:hypothetical protein